MRNIKFLHGKTYRPLQKSTLFDSEEYAKQERGSAMAYEVTSFAAQVILIRLVALTMPFATIISVTVCIIGEFVMRANIQAASRVILAKKDEGKKDEAVKGRRLLLPQSWKIIVSKAVAWILVWGCFGFLNQKADFEKGIGRIEYNQSEKAQLQQAAQQFNIDSSKAVTMLSSEKEAIKSDIKGSNSAKVTTKQNAINAAQNALNIALRDKDLQGEVIARRQLASAKSIAISTAKVDYTQAENDYQTRLNDARQALAKAEKDVLASVENRNGSKSLSHSFEMGLFLALVLIVAVCIYLVEEYKKLSDLDHFGLESVFVKREKVFQEVEPQFVTVFEDVVPSVRTEVFERLGLTVKSVQSAKARGSDLVEQAAAKCRAEGYDLYFKDGSNYPYLRRIKRKRA